MSGSVRSVPAGRRPKMAAWNQSYEAETASQCSSESADRFGADLRPPDVGQRIHSLYKNQMYTDVKFLVSCGVKPKPTILAHKAILAIGSPKFADMLYGDPKGQQDVIQINNTPFHAFASVVEYLYTDDVYFESDSQVIEILATANAFEVSSLATRCESYLASAEISETNVCTKLQLATTHKLQSLKERCNEFVRENTAAVISSFNFKRTERSTVRNICKLEKLNLGSEKELILAVMEWIEEQTPCGKSKRELLEPFLQHIRFLSLSCAEFNELVSKYPDVFGTEESLSLLMFLSSPLTHRQNYTLPYWCSKASNRCVGARGMQPQRLNRNISEQSGRQLLIGLRSSHLPYAKYVMCMLEIKCREGHHQIKALKLAFDEPAGADSCIDRLVITVSTEPSNFSLKEGIRVRNSSQVTVPFTRKVLVRRGETVYIQAEAKEVTNYKFLRFDEDHSFSQDTPFECSAGSIPKERRLFFISEVIYEPAIRARTPPDRNRPTRSYQHNSPMKFRS